MARRKEGFWLDRLAVSERYLQSRTAEKNEGVGRGRRDCGVPRKFQSKQC
jgi:hypothetical protein